MLLASELKVGQRIAWAGGPRAILKIETVDNSAARFKADRSEQAVKLHFDKGVAMIVHPEQCFRLAESVEGLPLFEFSE